MPAGYEKMRDSFIKKGMSSKNAKKKAAMIWNAKHKGGDTVGERQEVMPAILERLVSQLEDKGKSKEAAYAIATSALQKSGNLKPGTQQATDKGTIRGAMSPGERAIDRASRKSRHSKSDYSYNSSTNRATLK